MRTSPCSLSSALGRVLRTAASAALFVLLGSAGLIAQDLELPDPDPTVEVFSRRCEISWPEIVGGAGRQAQIFRLFNWDPDSSSTVALSGEYVGDCDYRLTLKKISQDYGFNLNVLIEAKLYENEALVGAPVAIDTVRLYQPGVEYALDPDVAGNLRLSVTGNVNQPESPLGTIPVTVSGLNTSIPLDSEYFVTPLSAVTDFSAALTDSLVVLVAGPFRAEGDSVPFGLWKRDTLTVHVPGDTFAVMNGMELSFGPGSTAPGDTVFWSARYLFPSTARVDINLEAFEGYHLWRSDLPDLGYFELLATIRPCVSKADFALVSEDELLDINLELFYDDYEQTFRVVDRDVHDDFVYRYAVSTYDTEFLGNPEGKVYEGNKIEDLDNKFDGTFYPGQLSRNPSQPAYVVPNPYRKRADWEQDEPKVVFTNLPDRCRIRVYTVAADLVTTFEHGPEEARTTSATTVTWDLRSDNGENIKPGIYIYHIEGIGSDASFEQTGKMVVVR